MSGHSIIPPSSAHIWGAPDGCTGWVTMSQCHPEPDEPTPESAEGTAAHEIGSRLIMNQTVGHINNGAENFVGNVATNGVIFTDEMFEAAEIYADDVGEIMRKTGVFAGDNFGNERRIEAPNIHEHSFGTVDQFIFDKQSGILYIWDFKFGHGIVEAFENWQLINYVAGILDANGLTDPYITVNMRIVQPRAFHRDGAIREWSVMLSDLRAHFNVLRTNAAIALGSDSMTRSGAHCRHCSARHACEAALNAGVQLFEVSAKPVPLEIPPAAIGLQLSIVERAIKQLEFLKSGYSEQIKSLIKSGVSVPNWGVEQGVGREKWDKPAAEVITMGEMMGFDVRKPVEAITPVQARKLGIDDAIIIAYSIKPSTGLKLVSDNSEKAKRIFNNVN